MKIKFFIYLVLIYILCLGKLYATDPEVFVQSTVNRASKILSEEMSKQDKMNELQKIAKETVDIRGIGFYTLGSNRKI